MSDSVVRPVVKLVGNDGNDFSIMGACRTAWRRAGNSMAVWETIQADMLSGDYDHLLGVACEHFDVQ